MTISKEPPEHNQLEDETYHEFQQIRLRMDLFESVKTAIQIFLDKDDELK